MRDVTLRRQLERELKHRAFHDPLTGLANRVLFNDRAEQALRRTPRTGRLAAVMFCDLVGFTARAEQLDPEDVRRLLQPYHAQVRSELDTLLQGGNAMVRKQLKVLRDGSQPA